MIQLPGVQLHMYNFMHVHAPAGVVCGKRPRSSCALKKGCVSVACLLFCCQVARVLGVDLSPNEVEEASRRFTELVEQSARKKGEAGWTGSGRQCECRCL